MSNKRQEEPKNKLCIKIKNQYIEHMNNASTAEAKMMIRKPVSIVFQAFVDPAVTTNFWFTKSNGILEEGKTITWEWEMFALSVKVMVKRIEQDKKISIEWGDPATMVDFEFNALTEDTTYVVIKNYGFTQRGDELLEVIKDSTGGFTTVIDGMKAYLEHGIRLNLISDKFPDKLKRS
jgi:uncharacterized protein YndB with AHSA1/START domain